METIEIIKDVLNETLDIERDDVNVEASFESLGIDSLDMAELICEIEGRLEIEFGEPEGLETVGALVEYLDTLR